MQIFSWNPCLPIKSSIPNDASARLVLTCVLHACQVQNPIIAVGDSLGAKPRVITVQLDVPCSAVWSAFGCLGTHFLQAVYCIGPQAGHDLTVPRMFASSPWIPCRLTTRNPHRIRILAQCGSRRPGVPALLSALPEVQNPSYPWPLATPCASSYRRCCCTEYP